MVEEEIKEMNSPVKKEENMDYKINNILQV